MLSAFDFFRRCCNWIRILGKKRQNESSTAADTFSLCSLAGTERESAPICCCLSTASLMLLQTRWHTKVFANRTQRYKIEDKCRRFDNKWKQLLPLSLQLSNCTNQQMIWRTFREIRVSNTLAIDSLIAAWHFPQLHIQRDATQFGIKMKKLKANLTWQQNARSWSLNGRQIKK